MELNMGLESLQLLVNGLHLCLTLGGDSSVDDDSHLASPVWLELSRPLVTTLDPGSNA